MAEQTYPWPRFWVPSDGTIDLSDGGFLRDPTDWLAGPQGLVPLAALQPRRALVLLGEPGIGKSTTLKEEADRIALLPWRRNLVSIYVDLRAFSSDVLLYRRIFESEKFIAWKNGNSHLFLHLDSLDEALLRINSIANLLASELPGIPTERLSIRIACRTAVWPADTLGAALTSIWGEAAAAFELAPLRREDVFTALDAHGIRNRRLHAGAARCTSGSFRHQAADAQNAADDLSAARRSPEQQHRTLQARMPRTLRGTKQKPAQFRAAADNSTPVSACVWPGGSRRQRSSATVLPSGPGRRSTVRAEDIPISALAGHREEGDFAAFTATDDDVREVLDTGLFSSRGDSAWVGRTRVTASFSRRSTSSSEAFPPRRC